MKSIKLYLLKITRSSTLQLLGCGLFFLLIGNGCFKDHDELVPSLDGVPAGGLTNVRLLNIDSVSAELSMTLFAVDHFGAFIEGLTIDDFKVASDNAMDQMEITAVEEFELEKKGPFSAALLFDQSGSISSTDPNNARVTAGSSFANLIDDGDEALVAAFSGGSTYLNPYEILEDFSKNQIQLVAAINSLAGQTGGSTPLNASIFEMISYAAAQSSNENKAIVAFTDGQNTDGGASEEEIIQAACAAGVQVFTIGLGEGIQIEELSRIAFETGGAVMLAKDAIQLVALYNSLGDLLHGEARVYQLRVKIKRPAGSQWTIGSLISGAINLPLSELTTLYFPFKTLLTNDQLGIWHEQLPDCPCTYEAAQDLLLSVCSGGIWLDCFNANPEFHYGAKKEIRWVPDSGGKPGQQCTYDEEGKLITGGIAAGSPDLSSPLACGIYEWLEEVSSGNPDPIFGFVGHQLADINTWESKPCWEYLRDWPANQGDNCFANNRVTRIDHMPKMIGDMNCRQATLLFKVVDENLGENHNLRKWFHYEMTFYSDQDIIEDLTILKTDLGCIGIFDSDECDVINEALDNLQ